MHSEVSRRMAVNRYPSNDKLLAKREWCSVR